MRRTHGERHCNNGNATVEYSAWMAMRWRCSPSHPRHADYHGRGIKVCARWNDYETFLADMGRKPSKQYSLDRINNDGGYGPSNCRWATAAEQNHNKRNNIFLEFRGERKTLTEWAIEMGMENSLLYSRLFYRGWPVDKALTKRTKKMKAIGA